MKNFETFLNRKRIEYGSTDHQFDDSALAKQFIPFYENEKRIEVSFISKDGKTTYETKR